MKNAKFASAALLLTVACSTAPPPAPAPEAAKAPASEGTVLRVDPSVDALVPKDAVIEKIAGGFTFIEGPLWRPNGTLLFSDVVGNVVREWNSADNKVTEVLKPGGYDGTALPPGGFIGPNGIAAAKDGGVLICQHGNRRIAHRDKDGKVTTLVDKFEGKKFNSPNDLVYHSDGSLYFTDPPYGLPKQDDDPTKEIKFNGVYRLKDGKVTALDRTMTRPNGIAFSPDYKVLYVANSDEKKKLWMRFDVAADGTLSGGKVFFDATSDTGDGLPDGLKVDTQGNVYATGPGGIWIFSPAGKHLGTIKATETPANCGWGDDGKSLYMTARTGLYRIKLAAAGFKNLYQ